MFCFLPDLDMKKDIDTLIAEERAEIIIKYDTVSVRATVPGPCRIGRSCTAEYLPTQSVFSLGQMACLLQRGS